MKNIYELQTYIIVNQQEYEKLKSLLRYNYISHEICSCCGFDLDICYGSCYNIKCEKYLRNNKQLFKNYNNEYYSVPVVKRLILTEIEASVIEGNLKSYENICLEI
jgi:hypothetical protein